MDVAEFDKFADEYHNLHQENIRITGENPEYFAEYKIRDLSRVEQIVGGEVKNILDFGTGVGSSIPFLAQYFPGTSLFGTDVSENSLTIARKRFPGLGEFSLFDGNMLPYSEGQFDLALATCVFHHIPANEHIQLIQEVSRTLRSGGAFMIYEHNPINPMTLHAVNTCSFDENAVLLKRCQVRNVLREAGMEVVMQEYRVFFPAILKFLRPLEKYLTWFPLGAQHFVVGKKL
jgi:SAM-dependent methyltransferase